MHSNINIWDCTALPKVWPHYAFWFHRGLLRVPWTARRSNQSTQKEINSENSLEGLMLKLKLQYFGHLIGSANSLEKNPDAGKDWRQEENEMTEDETVGWDHRLNGHEFEQTQGNSEGQGSLAGCSLWGWKASDATEGLNSNKTTGMVPATYKLIINPTDVKGPGQHRLRIQFTIC